jgi:hypothetical protein
MANDECQPIRDAVAQSQKDIREAEDLLPELLGPVKQSIKEFIRTEKNHLSQLRSELEACEGGSDA